MTTLQMKKLANPAREARKQYLADRFLAAINGDDIDHPVEALEWLCHLTELCGPHAIDPEIAAWYANEEARLLKLAGP
jgi:hypothetical protein